MPVIVTRIAFCFTDQEIKAGELENYLKDQIEFFERRDRCSLIALTPFDNHNLSNGKAGVLIAVFQKNK